MIKHRALYINIAFFGIIYSLISLVNHYNFRTFGYDLGLFNNAIYDYAHFEWNNVTLLLPNFKITNTLGDHFSLLSILFSPFYWLFGSYTLLIFQILPLLWGGVGIYRWVFLKFDSYRIASLAQIHFYSLWGIFSALSFDYHDNVVAACLVPWVLYYVQKQNFKVVALYSFFILVSKENMAIWLAFIFLGIILDKGLNKKIRFVFGSAAIICIVYFIVIANFVIPLFSSDDQLYIHFKFSALGDSMSEALLKCISSPQKVLTLLFENHLHEPIAYGIKTELHLVVLLSGGFALIKHPRYLVMLIPIYAQKLFNDDLTKWGINWQYSIEFAPILTIAVFDWLKSFQNKKHHVTLGFLICAITIATTISKLNGRVSAYWSPERERFYQKTHYKPEYNVHNVYEGLKRIPDNAKLSAQSMLVPHVSFRETIYHYPYIGDSEYIALLVTANLKYPLNHEQYHLKLNELINSKEWRIHFKNNDIVILKRTP